MATGPLDDPLLQQSRALETDRLVLTSCDVGLQAALSQQHPPLGREDTNALLWLAMQLVYIESEARRRSRLGHLAIWPPLRIVLKSQPFRQGVRNSHNLSHVTQGVGTLDGDHAPRRRTITYPRKPLKLEWKEPIQTTTTTMSDSCNKNQDTPLPTQTQDD